MEEQVAFEALVLSHVNDAVIAIDNSGCITYFNRAAEHLYGISGEHALRRPLQDVYAYRWVRPEDETEADTSLAHTGQWRGENIHVRGDGVTLWVESVVSILKNEAGTPTGLLAVIRDISRRKRAEAALRASEAALRESEARFRTLADAVPQIIWTNEPEGKANYFNQRWYQYSGLSYEESADPGWQVIVHPDDAPASVERWQRALSAGEMFDTEYRLRRADGVYRWQLGRNVPLRDGDSQIAGWFGSATDIEDLKQAEAALRESEERFRLMVEGARDYAMYLLDPVNRITFWSAGAERVFGWSEAEAVGQPSALIFTPEDRARGAPEHEIDAARFEGRAEDQRWHLKQDGSHFWADGVLIRLDDAHGKLRGFVKVTRDATERKQTEIALQRAHDELERRVEQRTAALTTANQALQQEIVERKQVEAERALLLRRLITAQEDERHRIARELHDSLGQFLAALTIRLSALQGVAGDLPAVNDGIADLREVASQIDRELDRLTMELRPPALDDLGLAEALRGYVEEWRATSGIAVNMLVQGLEDTRLPAMAEATIYRVVQEALTNVLKHAQATHVSLILERRPQQLQLIVEDNGQGFDVQVERSERSRRRHFGLVGMSERAALAGGALLIESEPGGGTTIYLHIPLQEAIDGAGDASNE